MQISAKIIKLVLLIINMGVYLLTAIAFFSTIFTRHITNVQVVCCSGIGILSLSITALTAFIFLKKIRKLAFEGLFEVYMCQYPTSIFYSCGMIKLYSTFNNHIFTEQQAEYIGAIASVIYMITVVLLFTGLWLIEKKVSKRNAY